MKSGHGYQLLSGNEVGLLLLDYICSQKQKHGKMPSNPVFVKSIVTMDLAEKIAAHYGVETINVLTGFKFIGEVIGNLEKANDAIMADFHNGFTTVADKQITRTEDYSIGLNGLPKSDVLKYYFQGPEENGSVVIRPSGTEPKLKMYISVTAEDKAKAEVVERDCGRVGEAVVMRKKEINTIV